MIRSMFLVCLLTGCFDSLVSDRCATGYNLEAGHCVGVDGGGSGSGGDDGGTSTPPDAVISIEPIVPDAMTCQAPATACDGMCIDLSNDPNNCGRCGNVCESGICTAGVCEGGVAGHVIAIGHDYAQYHPSMARVLGNAISLGSRSDVSVAWFTGTASPTDMIDSIGATGAGMAMAGRSWHRVALTGNPTVSQLANVDVLIVAPQGGDGASEEVVGAEWVAAMDWYLTVGGVVIVLEGRQSTSYHLAHGAGLFTVDAPIDVTDQRIDLMDPSDAIAQHVITPYLGEGSSVAYPNAPSSVLGTGAGAVVFHVTRR